MTKLTHARTLSMWNGAFFISFTVFTHGWWWLVIFVHLLESSKWRRKWLTTNGSHFKDGVHKCLDHNNYLTYTHTQELQEKNTKSNRIGTNQGLFYLCGKKNLDSNGWNRVNDHCDHYHPNGSIQKIFLLHYTISLCVCE